MILRPGVLTARYIPAAQPILAAITPARGLSPRLGGPRPWLPPVCCPRSAQPFCPCSCRSAPTVAARSQVSSRTRDRRHTQQAEPSPVQRLSNIPRFRGAGNHLDGGGSARPAPAHARRLGTRPDRHLLPASHKRSESRSWRPPESCRSASWAKAACDPLRGMLVTLQLPGQSCCARPAVGLYIDVGVR